MDSVYKATGKVAIAAFDIQMDDEPVDKDDDSQQPKEKTKEDNFMTANIIEQQGVANVVMYEVKYDRKKHQIVSVHPVSDGLDISIDSE